MSIPISILDRFHQTAIEQSDHHYRLRNLQAALARKGIELKKS